MEFSIHIKSIEHINHNVLRIITDKPKNYSFTPGQATEVSIDKDGLRDQKRPFTFTGLPEDTDLEFTIKVYPSHNGVTDELDNMKVGDKLLIGEPWGTINYKGPGAFIAGGAGITPFVAILKDLNRKNQLDGNQLFFSNHAERDIIYKNNLQAWLGEDLHLTLSEEKNDQYAYGRIDKDFLKTHDIEVTKPVYLCGPPAMIDALESQLYEMGLPQSQLVVESA